MTTIDTTSTAAAAAAAAAAASAAKTTSTTGTTAMSQSDFMKLLVTQLQAQDPTNPVDQSQMASQLAQFSTLQATQDLNTTVTGLATSLASSQQASQVLSSASLVDRNVLVPATTAAYAGTAIAGAVNVSTAGPVTVNIADANGNVVRTINLGTQSAGLDQFTWDGTDNSGTAVASGSYTLSATSTGTDSLDTYLSGKVTGVGYGGTTVGTYLQVAGVGGVPLSSVAQIL
jgi:flagellar basal-body rod modification protein FlgD